MIPTHLYHYTTIETFKLILVNTTIRFNRLDLMNDPFEGHNSQLVCSRENVFASCWTAESRDELPMWHLYNKLKGVRIKMPVDLFNFGKEMVITKIEGSDNYLIKSKLGNEYIIERENLNPIIGKFFDKSYPFNSVYGPSKMEYVSSSELVEANLITNDDPRNSELFELHTNLIGQKKLDYWSFENEYRFRVFFADGLKIAGGMATIKTILENAPVKTEYIDIKFKAESLKGIEILLGPKTDKKDFDELEKTLKELEISDYKILKSRIKLYRY